MRNSLSNAELTSTVTESHLQVPSGSEYRLDGSHAVVVVVLRGELLRAQPVGGHNLDRERAGIDEATGVEHDLGDHRVVGDHHGHGAEESLQVIGKLRATWSRKESLSSDIY